jgi:hypothetical protein
MVDNMLHMLEEHAENMEELVKERQVQLSEETKRVEEILFSMLPR